MSKTVLVIGASGVIGRDYIRHVNESTDWNVIGICRRPPPDTSRVRYLSTDLSNPGDAREKLGNLPEITHMLYAGYTDRQGWAAQREPNTALLRNALDAVEQGSPDLERVILMQGQKYYGSHLGPFKTPTREDDARHMPPNFYFDQQDLLAERSESKAWDYVCLRPHMVAGYSEGSPMNIVMVLAVYASICKELGLPLKFPGKPKAFASVNQASDARLLSSAAQWSATTPACADQSYNITNGDFYRWQNFWPQMAKWFDMPVGDVQTINLAEFMGDKKSLWDEMVKKHSLEPIDFESAINWKFGDYVFSCEWDIMASTTRCRQHGFMEFLDSERRYLELFDELRELRIIP